MKSSRTIARVVGLALALATLSGCWNKNFQEPGRIEVQRKPTEAIFASNFQRVWAATQAAVGKFPVSKKDADTNLGRSYIVTEWIRGKSDILYHGFDVSRVPYTIRYKLYIYLVGENRFNRTKVSVKAVEQYLDDSITAGVDMQGGLYTWIATDSSSLKENSLIQQIDKLVNDPNFKVEAQ